MLDQEFRQRRLRARKRHYEEFYLRLLKRREGKPDHGDLLMKAPEAALPRAEIAPEAFGAGIEREAPQAPSRGLFLETMVRRERPVLFVESDWINKVEVTVDGAEAKELIIALDEQREKLQPLVPLVGRIDVAHFSGTSYLGTGWFVAEDIVVTNRHVAELMANQDGSRFVIRRGVGGRQMAPSVCTAHEFDDLAPDRERVFAVKEVLYIEPGKGPDIAFLRVARRAGGGKPPFIAVADTDLGADVPVVVIGYPARASKDVIEDQKRMDELFRGRYDVKRASPGMTMPPEAEGMRHDCTTLGGNSGSVVLDLKSGLAVGLHYAGLYDESNYAVRASVLAAYIRERRWTQAPSASIGGPREAAGATVTVTAPRAAADGSITFNVPLSVTVRLGAPGAQDGGAASATAASPAEADAAAKAFWDQRPAGVVGVRVGFLDEAGAIGDTPFIAASAPAERLAAVRAAGPARYRGLEVRYDSADLAELIDSEPGLEAAQSVSYDDDARTGAGYSFDYVDEPMSVLAHVGPEYSWDTLKAFLAGAKKSLVSAIYEFHGDHVAAALEDRLKKDVSLELVMDNATFSKAKADEGKFDRVKGFKAWAAGYAGKFKRVVAPEGASGLIANSYHIKVTVREDGTFWLSSGNWKKASSQPVVTQAERDNATRKDLEGNREWHVVIANKTLAERFRNHIQQDFRRSKDLGGREVPKSMETAVPEIYVDVPVLVPERAAPSRILLPRKFDERVRVKPLLTPDRSGAVYSDAVLDLIRGAKASLLFQIPYIGMPSNPRANRGYIDDLIKALTEKLQKLPDARVLLRTGGSDYSSPAHAAWYFKAKGVRIQERLRQIDDHHTKGMIVDGKRVLVGSHNWSQPGVSLNRDASLLFDHAGIAGYYAEAFEIDWERARPITPKRHAKQEGAVLEAAPGGPPTGYRRVRLADLLREDA